MPLFGRAIILLAFGVSAFAVVAALGGRTPRRRHWYLAAQRAVFASFGLLTIALGTLVVALMSNRFDLHAVEGYSSRSLEWYYKLTAVWASQPGSLLFWAWLLAGFASVAVIGNRTRNRQLMPVVVAVLAGLGSYFTVLLTFVASPFATVRVVPSDGNGLQAALRNPYMAAHPPLLYLGYVAIAVPFAFAIAALVTRRLDTAWLTSVRRWTLMSWAVLGLGIVVGAKWAYESLSFGGYWIWDPVENASFLPWLTATAFLHSVMVQERRGMLKVWNLVLIVVTFSLTLFGTFLTRSSLLSSIHNFGAQTVGPYLLGAIVVVLAGGIWLIVTRLPELRSEHSLESYLSREAVFLYNNLLLVGLAFAVLWGTLFPVLSELVTGEKITVGRGFFDQVAAPIGVALLVLTGIGPLVPWRKASARQLCTRFLPPAVVAAAATPIVLLTDARGSWPAAVTFVFAIFAAVCIGGEFWRGTKVRHALGGMSWPAALGQAIARNRRRYGGYIAHVGIVVAIVGIAASRSFISEGAFQLRAGESASAGGYTFTATGFQRAADANKMTVSAEVLIAKGADRVATLRPAKHVYRSSGQTGDTIAIATSPTRDIWVNLAGLSGGVASLHTFVNPMIAWIWMGGLILLIGAIIAGWPTGRRRRSEPAVAKGADRPVALTR